MQKGFISLPILTILVLVMSVVAGGGYTVYKINKIQQENSNVVAELEEKIEQMASTTNNSIEPVSETEEIATSSYIQVSSSTGAVSTENERKSSQITTVTTLSTQMTPTLPVSTPSDLCTNINGLQSVIPGGYKVEGSVCTRMEDKCFNIDGMQDTVPTGMLVFKGYGCMSEREMDKINKEENEVEQCEDLSDEIEELKLEHNAYLYETESTIIKIQNNAGGGLASGVNAEVSNYINSRNLGELELRNEINLKIGQFNLKCL